MLGPPVQWRHRARRAGPASLRQPQSQRGSLPVRPGACLGPTTTTTRGCGLGAQLETTTTAACRPRWTGRYRGPSFSQVVVVSGYHLATTTVVCRTVWLGPSLGPWLGKLAALEFGRAAAAAVPDLAPRHQISRLRLSRGVENGPLGPAKNRCVPLPPFPLNLQLFLLDRKSESQTGNLHKCGPHPAPRTPHPFEWAPLGAQGQSAAFVEDSTGPEQQTIEVARHTH